MPVTVPHNCGKFSVNTTILLYCMVAPSQQDWPIPSASVYFCAFYHTTSTSKTRYRRILWCAPRQQAIRFSRRLHEKRRKDDVRVRVRPSLFTPPFLALSLQTSFFIRDKLRLTTTTTTTIWYFMGLFLLPREREREEVAVLMVFWECLWMIGLFYS